VNGREVLDRGRRMDTRKVVDEGGKLDRRRDDNIYLI
jgi:hypothetical protein